MRILSGRQLSVPLSIVLSFGVGGAAVAAKNPADGDIRSLKVGVHVSTLDTQGYDHFSCVDRAAPRQSRELNSWEEFQSCAPSDDGLTKIDFRFDDGQQQWAPVNDKWEGTKLAGHPVRLSLLLDKLGYVAALRAVTDPDARPYMRKKAYLLGMRVKARYGSDGWRCERHDPDGRRRPIGGVFIDEHCEKTYHGRQLVLRTRLFRDAGAAPNAGYDAVTNATHFEIIGGKRPI